jgi:hypothetical protein
MKGPLECRKPLLLKAMHDLAQGGDTTQEYVDRVRVLCEDWEEASLDISTLKWNFTQGPSVKRSVRCAATLHEITLHPDASVNEICKKYISIFGSYTSNERKAVVNAVKGKRVFVCFKCRKPGHKIAECLEWSEKKPKTSGVVLMLSAYAMITAYPHIEKNIMWFDTGAR